MTYKEYWEKHWPLIDRRHDVAWAYLRGEKDTAYMAFWPFPYDLKTCTSKGHKEWRAYCSKMNAWQPTKEEVERGVQLWYEA